MFDKTQKTLSLKNSLVLLHCFVIRVVWLYTYQMVSLPIVSQQLLMKTKRERERYNTARCLYIGQMLINNFSR